MATTPPANLPSDVYAVFCSNIDQASVQRLFGAVATASQNRIQRIHLLFQSLGGSVGDGVCLYNFLKTAPVEIALYNVGSVQSIAAVAYLGAKKRKASSRATFAFHRTTASPQAANANLLKNIVGNVTVDDQRTESILREHIDMSEDKWLALNQGDLWFTAQEAVRAKIADEIEEFAPPAGTIIYNV
jgi:ATP-dependent Clp protease protease subunit